MFTGKKGLFLDLNMKICGCRNFRKHKEIKGSDNYVTLGISSKFDSLDKMRITSSDTNEITCDPSFKSPIQKNVNQQSTILYIMSQTSR